MFDGERIFETQSPNDVYFINLLIEIKLKLSSEWKMEMRLMWQLNKSEEHFNISFFFHHNN